MSVDGAHDVVDECGVIISKSSIISERSPCGVNGELLELSTAVNGCIVLIHHILALLAIALDDEFLHLLYGELYGDYTGDAEESALEDSVGAVAETYFLSYLGSVDVIY